jgi:hypothetical protein
MVPLAVVGVGHVAKRVLFADTLITTCMRTLTMLASFVTILTLAACM